MGYKQLPHLEGVPTGPKNQVGYVDDLTGGLDVSDIPKHIPLNASPHMRRVQFFGGGVLQDYELVTLGQSGSGQIAALDDFHYVSPTVIEFVLMRVLVSNTLIELQAIKPASETVFSSRGTFPRAAPYDFVVGPLSTLPIQGVYVIAPFGNPLNRRAAIYRPIIYDPLSTPNIAQINDGDIRPRFLVTFGDRLLALQDGVDQDVISVSRDGDVRKFTGTDTGQTALIDSRSGPVNALMGGASLGTNMLALFRRRSIMRAFETGNSVVPVGYNTWIEDLGTDSPFSIAEVPGGAIFLGNDRVVYYLSQSGPVPLSSKINTLLRTRISDNVDLVDGVYDSSLRLYWMGVPEQGSGWLTGLYAFDFGRWLDTGGQDTVWRYRIASADRIGFTRTAVS